MTDPVRNLIVDVDGTLCPTKSATDRYSDLVPYPEMVEMLRKRQGEGFRIILHTARNMRTHKSDLSLINRHTLPTLMDWVERWDIPCDGVIVGKPWPGHDGYYIDDRAVRPSEFLSMDHDALSAKLADEREAFAALRAGHGAAPTNIVITMAGLGSRFRKAGYTLPKYEIEVGGRTLFDWSMLSLRQFFARPYRLIFVMLDEMQAEPFVRKACSQSGLDIHGLVNLPELTDGQASSALAARDLWSPEAPLLIYNIDTFVEPQALSPEDIPEGADAWAPCFKAGGDHWSFIRMDERGDWAVEAAEKRRISSNATIGLYWFSSAGLYEKLYQDHFASGQGEEAGERYVAPMYSTLIAQNGKLGVSMAPTRTVHPLGTPAEVERFNPPRDLSR
ncbi:hypothetical protein ACFELO_02685 [Oceanicaulis sp. LC35]|uniref:hypothetical protein n=1 Tax=Oceanicaulis sp. LC35 TaxID=3349635 RepID=UPI003F8258BF